MSSSPVLFEIREENLDTGMRGFPVGYCTTSDVDPYKGLYYTGSPVSKMTDQEPISIIYRLFKGKDGSESELNSFKKDIASRSTLSQKVIEQIRALPMEGHPMKLFNMAILLSGIFEGKNEYAEDAYNLIAKIPIIGAAVINHHAGWNSFNEPNPELGYMENFTHMLNVPNANHDDLNKVFRLFNVLHYDHGGGNLSTFVAKATASGKEDTFGSICAGMCALAGPLHGKANQDCLNFVQEVYKELGDNATADQVEALVRKRLNNNQLVYGFGHAVLRVEDPRATIFYDYVKENYPDHPLVKIALFLRDRGSKVLKENPKISDPYPNVDAVSGTALSAAGFAYPEYFTVLFGISRCLGILAQILYERLKARDGKGVPLYRPESIYKPLNE